MTQGAPRGIRSRRFRLFWAARAISQFGDEITFLALPWLVAEQTGSSLAVSLIAAAGFAPVVVLGLPLGALTDRRSRRRSMLEADIGRFALLASVPLIIALGFDVSIAYVVVIAALVACLNVLFDSASQAALPQLVPSDELVAANSRLSFTEGIAVVAGPAVAGILIAAFEPAGALGVDALTFLASFALIAAIAIPFAKDAAMAEPFRRAIRAGLSAVRRGPHIRALVVVTGAANAAAGMAIGLIILLFEDVLALSAWQAGIIFAGQGVGGILGSLVCSRIVGGAGMGRTVLLGIAGLAGGILLMAMSSRALWWVLAVGGSVLLGIGITLAAIASSSLRQHVVPGGLLGRVTSVYRLVVDGAVAIGAVAGGLLGELIGVRPALITAAALLGGAALAGLATRLNAPDPPPVEVVA
jgi:MFS family permease